MRACEHCWKEHVFVIVVLYIDATLCHLDALDFLGILVGCSTDGCWSRHSHGSLHQSLCCSHA